LNDVVAAVKVEAGEDGRAVRQGRGIFGDVAKLAPTAVADGMPIHLHAVDDLMAWLAGSPQANDVDVEPGRSEGSYLA
jgi:hypothetical protein